MIGSFNAGYLGLAVGTLFLIAMLVWAAIRAFHYEKIKKTQGKAAADAEVAASDRRFLHRLRPLSPDATLAASLISQTVVIALATWLSIAIWGWVEQVESGEKSPDDLPRPIDVLYKQKGPLVAKLIFPLMLAVYIPIMGNASYQKVRNRQSGLLSVWIGESETCPYKQALVLARTANGQRSGQLRKVLRRKHLDSEGRKFPAQDLLAMALLEPFAGTGCDFGFAFVGWDIRSDSGDHFTELFLRFNLLLDGEGEEPMTQGLQWTEDGTTLFAGLGANASSEGSDPVADYEKIALVVQPEKRERVTEVVKELVMEPAGPKVPRGWVLVVGSDSEGLASDIARRSLSLLVPDDRKFEQKGI